LKQFLGHAMDSRSGRHLGRRRTGSSLKVMVAAAEEREDIAPAYGGGGFPCHMRGLDEVTHGNQRQSGQAH
jgi:hypothetical protein